MESGNAERKLTQFCSLCLLKICQKNLYLTKNSLYKKPLFSKDPARDPGHYCPPPFRRKVEGHCFWFSVGRGAWRVVRGSEFLVGTLSP